MFVLVRTITYAAPFVGLVLACDPDAAFPGVVRSAVLEQGRSV
jgi:hypothetical protein